MLDQPVEEMIRSAFALISLSAVVLTAEVFECPANESTGKFPDPDDCDKYWDCFRGEASPVFCPDGLAYDEKLSGQAEPCDYLYKVDCSTRLGIGEPQGEGACERRNGIYPHEDPNVCDMYYVCMDNRATLHHCPPGLHFNIATKTCDWERNAQRGACSALQQLNGFQCDPSKEYFTADGQKIVHPRFVHDDCSKFYVCKNGVAPAVSGCDDGLVFNDLTKECDDIANVPECNPDYDEPQAGAAASVNEESLAQ